MTSLANQPGRRIGEWVRSRADIAKLLRNPVVKAIFAAQVVAAVVVALRVYGWLQPLELLTYDMLRVGWAGQAPSHRVMLIGATEKDINAEDRNGDRVWGWPLRDGALATVLERVASWKPRAIGVDLYRDIPEPPGSSELDAVMRRHPEIYWVFKLRDDATHLGVPPPKILRNSDQAVLADTVADSDDVVRRGLLYAGDDKNQYATLGMQLAQVYLAHDHIYLQSDAAGDLLLGKAVIKPLDATPGPYAVPDSQGYQILLDYHGGAQPFRQVSLSRLVADDDLAPLVRDRIVILGVAADSVNDWFTTPFSTGFGHGERVNGIALHAHLADQLIREALGHSAVLRELPRRFEYLWIIAWALAGAGLGVAFRSTLAAVAGGGAGVAIIGAIAYVAFGRALLLPAVPAAAAWLGAGILTNQLLYAASNRSRAVLRQAFEHYLPRSVIDQLVKSDRAPSLEGELREISVLFTDVAGFTNFSEARDPAELANITNQYLEGVSSAILAHEGLVNAFMGDGVLAFFGAPQAQPDHADRAVSAALAIDRFAESFSKEQNGRGINFGHTRIGIHTGIAFVGNIGSSRRLQYTALGDMLNTGSRLEGLNKAIGSRVCVSLEVVAKCTQHRFRPVGDFIVKGRTTPTQVYTPVDPECDSPEWIARYDAAFHRLAMHDDAARDLFATLHADNPDDPCVSFHYDRLGRGEVGTMIEMQEK
jgi:adenylate cyclase